MSSYHARLTANALRDAANFIIEQADALSALDRERNAHQRLREALVQIATQSTDEASRRIATMALRPIRVVQVDNMQAAAD
jgi:hypothetical protein